MPPTFHVFAGFLPPEKCSELIDDFETGRATGKASRPDALGRLSFEIGDPSHWLRRTLISAVEG
jgi:hypothetical protein